VQKLLSAMNSVPGILSYNSVALSYLPRPDNVTLVASPELVAATGKFPPIPFIIGDQEDEGTIFALFQSNTTTTAQIQDYLKALYFNNADNSIISGLVATYPDDPTAGSPFGTGNDNNWYPQYKRLAALLGDATFTLARRAVLNLTTVIQPTVKRWSYLSSYDMGTPILGTFHGSDLIQTFYGIKPNFAAVATLGYDLNFVYNLDPNDASGGTRAAMKVKLPNWPPWGEGQMLLNFKADSASLIPDNFRQESFDFILNNAVKLHF
jgi:carboxylesterase type B